MGRKNTIILSSIQKFFLTGILFAQNDLATYASAGSYGFFLSIVPIIMMILAVLLRFLHTSPDILLQLVNLDAIFKDPADAEHVINSILSVKKVGIFEIIIGFSIFWMARRFFSSIMQGIKTIFRGKVNSRPIKQNLLVIAAEVLLVIVAVLFILILVAANSFVGTSLAEKFIPKVMYNIILLLLKFVPVGIMFIFIFLTYVFAPGTHPPKKLCILAAVGCTASFSIVYFFLKLFINWSKYNIIYGVFSNLVVVLLEVFIFFILFLFFAQFIYVLQFFDILLLTQLYMLPPRDDLDVLAAIKRSLFINPYKFIKGNEKVYAKGDIIFNEKDESDDIYYIRNGYVSISSTNRLDYFERGECFGELSYILNIPRTGTAVAQSDSHIIKIDSAFFSEVLAQSPETNSRAVETVSNYVRQLYNSL